MGVACSWLVRRIGGRFKLRHSTEDDLKIILKDTCIPMFTAALFTIAKTWKQPKCQLNR